MASSVLKMLAQKAKKRLSTAGQNFKENTKAKTTFAYLSQGDYMLVASNQKIKEDPLFEKVKKLLSDENAYNPLSKLVEKDVFSKLSEEEKERYMLDISKRYNEIKNYCLSGEEI